MGLGWFTVNTRAARRADPGRPAPSFVGRLAALHGSAAALTVALAALTALVLEAARLNVAPGQAGGQCRRRLHG